MRGILVLNIVLAMNITFFAQLSALEDIEKTAQKGFMGSYVKNFFKDFTDFGDPFTLAGSIGLNMRSYDAFGGTLRQDPFFYTVNGSLNIKVYQLDIPLSMVLTAKNSNSSYPSFSDLKNSLKNSIDRKKKSFGRFGISPHYKWAKVHIGHRSMNFSKYTLSNLNFFGGGVELTPGKIRLSAMYGRLAKAEPVDLSLVTPNFPIYERTGWGTKLGYGDENASADILLFSAKDAENSITIPDTFRNQVSPEANFAIALQVQKLFLEKIRFKFEITRSGVSPNLLDARSTDGNITDFLLVKRNTSYYGGAMEGSLGFEGKRMNAGIQFNRVDANFKTFGAYFFNRDVFDISGFTNFGLFESKLNSSLKIGIQSNNLDNTKSSTTSRLIYDLQTVWSDKDFNAQFNYSNNASSVSYVLNPQLDSLNAVVVTEDLGINLSYQLPFAGEDKHSVSLTGNIQDVSDDIEKPSRISVSTLYLVNAQYMLNTKSKWSFSARANYTISEILSNDLKRFGVGASVRKAFFKEKLNVGFNVNYFSNSNAAGDKSNNTNGQITFATQPFKGMSLQFGWGLLSTRSDAVPTFTESTGNLGLQYTFNYKPGKK